MVKSGKTPSGKKPVKKASKAKKAAKAEKTELTEVSYDSGLHEIPHGYNIDTIVLMPVNMDTSFIYWEITDSLLNGKRKKLKSGSAQLMVKVFEADCLTEVCSFEVQERIGSSYINYQSSMKPLVAEIGISNGNGFVGLLKTRTEVSPPNSSSLPGEPSVPDRSHGTGKHTLHNTTPSTLSSEAKTEVWMTNKEGCISITREPLHESFLVMEKIINYYRDVSDSHETSFFNKA